MHDQGSVRICEESDRVLDNRRCAAHSVRGCRGSQNYRNLLRCSERWIFLAITQLPQETSSSPCVIQLPCAKSPFTCITQLPCRLPAQSLLSLVSLNCPAVCLRQHRPLSWLPSSVAFTTHLCQPRAIKPTTVATEEIELDPRVQAFLISTDDEDASIRDFMDISCRG